MLTIVKAAVVALALSAGAVVTAVPVQAQGFSFNFQFGNDRFDNFPRVCLTESQLRRAIRDQGYRNVALNVEMSDHRIHIRATRGGWVYQLLVNACSGRILDRERLRRS